MIEIDAQRSRMARQAMAIATGNGYTPSPVPRVKILYVDRHCPRQPVMYEPGIVIVFQGHKVGYCGNKMFQYDPRNYLLMTVPLPFECETFASPELPLVGLAVNIDTQMLQDLLIDIGDDDYLMQPRAESNGVNLAELTEALLCATERLLDVMAKPLDARVLGPQIVREILYYVLRGTCGASLQELVNRHTHFSQIAGAAAHRKSICRQPQRRTVGQRGQHERLGVPPQLQGGDQHLAAAIREVVPAA